MNAEIITVGSELLSGKQSNTNAQYLSEQLKHIGIEVTLQSTVGDHQNDLQKLLSSALSRSNIVVLTGGLGPTKDDITKQAVCDLLGIKMKADESSLSKIENYFFRKGEKMADNNIRQAMLPEGSIVLKNDVGLSPGCILKSGNQCIVMLPGPPSEMHPMFENGVKPFLKTMTGFHVVSKTVNVFGMSESLIAEALDDLITKGYPAIATYASGGKTDIFVSAKAEDVKAASRDVEITVEEIRRRLGDVVYGVDEPSLHHAVVRDLVSRKVTIATAESCTGGLLSKKITDISGSSLCFEFGVTSYSESAKNTALGVDEESLKQFGAVSAETACQMAVGAMNRSASDLGVSITGYAGPVSMIGEPVGLVFIAVCNRETVWVKRFELAPGGKETREQIREMATMHAFDMIRRTLNGLAIFNSQRLPVAEVSNSDESREAARGKRLFQNEVNQQAVVESAEEPKAFEKSFRGRLSAFAWKLFPNKQDDRVEKVRKSVFLTASVALLVSVCYIAGFFLSIQQNKNMYNNLEKLKEQKPSASITYPEGYLEEFGLLYQENPDIVGWVEIEGTELNYPVVQGDDNDYYLTHNFYGKKERHGVPFMDYRNDPQTLDTNTILHGHNMKSDNQMFSELEKYYKGSNALNYYRHHPTITFDTAYEKMKWKIFAVFTCNVNTGNGEVFPYYDFINPSSSKEFEEFLAEVRNKSIFNIPVDVDVNDRILTLSTCYYEYDGQRLVVMARKLREGESTVVDVNSATHNRGGNTAPTSSQDSQTDEISSNQSNNSTNYPWYPQTNANSSRNQGVNSSRVETSSLQSSSQTLLSSDVTDESSSEEETSSVESSSETSSNQTISSEVSSNESSSQPPADVVDSSSQLPPETSSETEAPEPPANESTLLDQQ